RSVVGEPGYLDGQGGTVAGIRNAGEPGQAPRIQVDLERDRVGDRDRMAPRTAWIDRLGGELGDDPAVVEPATTGSRVVDQPTQPHPVTGAVDPAGTGDPVEGRRQVQTVHGGAKVKVESRPRPHIARIDPSLRRLPHPRPRV